MERQIQKLLKCCADSNMRIPFTLPNIYITGHSLCGALDQLLALNIACNVEISIDNEERSSQKHTRGH